MFSPPPRRGEDARHAGSTGMTYGMGDVSAAEIDPYIRAPDISLSTDGFVKMRRLRAQVSSQQQHINQLTARCNALVQQVNIQARARQASAAEVTLLRSHLRELQRWHVGRLVPASVGGTACFSACHGQPAAREFSPAVNSGTSTSLTGGHLLPSEPPSDTVVSPLYPREIPEAHRPALRMRMMQDRGPMRPHVLQAPPEVPRPRPPTPDVPQPSHLDCETSSSQDTAPPPDAKEDGGVADPMSPSRAEEGGVVAAEDSEETEDECLDRHFGTDDEDSDDEPPQSPDPTDTKPEPHSRGECVEPPPVDVSPVKTEAGSSDLFVVATHGLERPRDLDLERPSDPDPECALAGVHPPSRDITRSVNGCDETGVVTGSVSGTSSEAPVTAPSSAKEEPVFNDLEEAVAPVPVAARYTHQLFSSAPTGVDEKMRPRETSMKPDDSRRSTDQGEVTCSEKSDASSVDSEPLHRVSFCRGWDRYQHCTFCSLCRAFRTEPQAIAKCEACPRILCRKCAARKGEEVPRSAFAADVALPAEKCRCQSDDAEFPEPREGKDPQAHLLKYLFRHDLSQMFREAVNVEDNPGYLGVVPREDMMDLRTVETKLKKNKQYRSPRGQMLFRADLQKIWVNCWKYAAYRPDRDDISAGIVRCTLILQAMVEKFYFDHMGQLEVATHDSWRAGSDSRERERLGRCTRPAPKPQLWPSGTFCDALDPLDGSDEETDTDLDEENSRIGATVGHKRRFVFANDDDDDDGTGSASGIRMSPKTAVADAASVAVSS